jgi:hypothetical protein
MRKMLVVVALFLMSLLWIFRPVRAADKKASGPDQVPKEVRALQGTYRGSWTMFGVDEKGDVVKRMAWTDTMTAANPQIKGDRAYVTTVDEMLFEDKSAPPFKVNGKEGHFLTKEGTPGAYFVETFGQVQRMVKLGDNVWSFVAPAGAQELGRLGFPSGTAGQHVVVKVVTKEQAAETHRISRLTTVHWKDKDGKERWLQYVSLQGTHKRVP